MKRETAINSLKKLISFYQFMEDTKDEKTYKMDKSIDDIAESNELMLAEHMDIQPKIVKDWAMYGQEDAESFYDSHKS